MKAKDLLLPLSFLFLCLVQVQAKSSFAPKQAVKYNDEEVSFEENKGQIGLWSNFDFAQDALFFSRQKGLTICLKKDRIVFLYTAAHRKTERAVTLSFVHANAEPFIEGSARSFYNNYYTVDKPQGFEASSYSSVVYHDLYKGIDLEIKGEKEQLEYSFIVHPGADASVIKTHWSGRYKKNLRSGCSTISCALGKLTEQQPFVYQQAGMLKRRIRAFAISSGSSTSYQLAAYDHNSDIVIDPVVKWGTFYGGTGSETYRNIALCSNEDVVVDGYYISAKGLAVQKMLFARYDSAGHKKWVTYFDTDSNTYSIAMTLDHEDNILILGHTDGNRNIATANAFQSKRAGDYDMCIEKFDSSGKRIWGTYFGGTSYETPGSISVDSKDNIIIVGTTYSLGLATKGVYDEQKHEDDNPFSDHEDAIVAMFDSSGARKWCTYYGGTGYDQGDDVAIASNDDIIITGFTSCNSLASSNAAQKKFGGGLQDMFIARFDTTGNLRWSTYFGGAANEYGFNVQLDPSGNIIVAGGQSDSPRISIATKGAFLTSPPGKFDFLLCKFDSTGKNLWATYIGGEDAEGFITDLAIDSAANIYMASFTQSKTGIASKGAMQPNLINIESAFLCSFSASGRRNWATYYGGIDFFTGIAMDSHRHIFCAGAAGAPGNAPTNISTPGADQPKFGGGDQDGILVRFDPLKPPTPYLSDDTSGICQNSIKTYSVSHTANHIYKWQPKGGRVVSGQDSSQVNIQWTKAGMDTLMLTEFNEDMDSGIGIAKIKILPLSGASFKVSDTCFGFPVSFKNTSGTARFWFWDFGDGTNGNDLNPVHSYTKPGKYTVSLVNVTAKGCADTARRTVTVHALPDASFSISTDTTDNIYFSAKNNTYNTYFWQFGDSSIAGSPKTSHLYDSSGWYHVKLTVIDSFGCATTKDTLIRIHKSGLYDKRQTIRNISMYPDPFSDQLNISFEMLKEADANVLVYDSKGALLSKRKLSHCPQGSVSIQLNAADFGNRAGAFVIRITSSGGSISRKVERY